MKFLVAFALALACVHADVSHIDAGASILRSEADVQPDSFSYVYETSNGIAAQAKGVIKNVGSENAAQEVQGSFSYTDPEGKPVQVSYVADENGFQPQGEHLPTPPPVPADIARALAYIAAHPPAEDKYVNTAARVSAPAAIPSYSKPFNNKFSNKKF